MRRLLVATLAASAVSAASAKDERSAITATKTASLVVDEAWGGTGVSYDAVSIGTMVYIAYYDADRIFSVARVDTSTGRVEKKQLDSRFEGWDAHNSTAIALDETGRLHVSGNMHSSPLVYARQLERDAFASLSQIDSMVGMDESSVTYPRFFQFPNGDLGFSYRSGRSGDGTELINRFDGEHWTRVLSQPLFAPAPSGVHVNAYHTGYIRGRDGRFHVAWVWRETRFAETNFNVLYARSTDLRRWEDSQGRVLTLPITPMNAEVVAVVPQRTGLTNNVKLGFDAEGLPVISYLHHDGRGHSQLFHARPGRNGWQRVQATNWSYRWDFVGPGTRVGEIEFSGVRADQGRLVEDVTHRRYGRLRMDMDPLTLESSQRHVPSTTPYANVAPDVEAPFRLNVREVRPANAQSFRGTILWRTLGSGNNDKPRSCESVNLPKDCRMSGPLELIGRPHAASATVPKQHR